jgi:AcrR family transcriptional regulator
MPGRMMLRKPAVRAPDAGAVQADKKPRTKPAEIRRDELMDSGQSLFLSKGFGATSIEEIAQKAGVAKGTLYLYFKSKDDLLLSLQSRFVDNFCRKVEEATRAPDAPWPSRLESFVTACVDTYLDDYALHDLVFHQYNPADRRSKSDNSVTRLLEALLQQGKAEQAHRIDDVRLTAIMLFDALHGAVDSEIHRGSRTDRKQLSKNVLSFYRNALNMA